MVFGTVYMFPYAAEALAYAAGAPLLAVVGPQWVLVISGLGVLATVGLIAALLTRALGLRLPTPGRFAAANG
ncbi:hypothetical protein [Micromonospora sp. NPDC005171]|uniref:hypothetical protein n=1 Tax=Micromonospora sp. NPDC005171 TaxID=3156866 RepID=UPI0033A208DE